MATLLQSASTDDRLPHVLRHCQRCSMSTPHEIHAGVVVCLLCIERARNYELDRD